MRAMAIYLLAVASAGCLRNPEFRCLTNAECGPSGVCELQVGFCSVPNAACAGTGRSFSDSAGNLANTCVTNGPPPDADAGVDVPIDMPDPVVGCPMPEFMAVTGQTHLYKKLPSTISWDNAAGSAGNCKRSSMSAYLAVPDDPTELASIATVAGGTPFWVGVDDKATQGTFVTQTGMTASFLPWATGQPDQSQPPKRCVEVLSTMEYATDRCGNSHIAVCECEP
jgi:hypothetical protein